MEKYFHIRNLFVLYKLLYDFLFTIIEKSKKKTKNQNDNQLIILIISLLKNITLLISLRPISLIFWSSIIFITLKIFFNTKSVAMEIIIPNKLTTIPIIDNVLIFYFFI